MKQTIIKTRGLVLGKFAPLHKGHQYLIETALGEMDEVLVLIYNCPETTDIPLRKRADWIRQLYPRAKVIEAWDGPTETGYTERIKKLNEDYVLQKIKAPITHFYSSELYGEHMSRALKCVNWVVDMERQKYPISGMLIRQNPAAYKEFLDPIVYHNLVKKVVFLGAESTGKTTLTKKLAEMFGTQWMPEHGREYWEKHSVGGKLTLEQLVDLAKEHLEREEELLPKANNYLFVDTNAITTEMFSRYYHGEAHPELKRLARAAEKRYDYCFVCATDIPYEEDGTRNGETHRKTFQEEILADLDKRGINYVLLGGNIQERIAKVMEVMGVMDKEKTTESYKEKRAVYCPIPAYC